jgi:DegV family protein with EDD domain
MNNSFAISTDTSCDAFKSALDKDGIYWIPLTFTIDGTVYEDDFDSEAQYEEFYKKVWAGATPVTSQINIFNHEEFFNSILDKGHSEVVHLTLSGGLSNTYSSACIAAANAEKARPDCRITVVDTLSATQGHNLVLQKLVELQRRGLSAGQAARETCEFAARLQHWIIVDNLMHLKRGGRVSLASAFVGSLFQIKPILIINDIGKLSVVKKVKGMSGACKTLFDMFRQNCADPENAVVYLADADAKGARAEMKGLLTEKYKNITVREGWVGPVIGAHVGNGMIGLVFEAKTRLTNKGG